LPSASEPTPGEPLRARFVDGPVVTSTADVVSEEEEDDVPFGGSKKGAHFHRGKRKVGGVNRVSKPKQIKHDLINKLWKIHTNRGSNNEEGTRLEAYLPTDGQDPRFLCRTSIYTMIRYGACVADLDEAMEVFDDNLQDRTARDSGAPEMRSLSPVVLTAPTVPNPAWGAEPVRRSLPKNALSDTSGSSWTKDNESDIFGPPKPPYCDGPLVQAVPNIPDSRLPPPVLTANYVEATRAWNKKFPNHVLQRTGPLSIDGSMIKRRSS
jgi:hypothetical protein